VGSSKATFNARFQKGLCIWCGDEPHDEGKKSCGACRAKRNALSQQWTADNPEKRRAQRKRYEQANPDKVRALQTKGAQAYRRRVRAKVTAAYGGSCACCGESEPLFLTIDHVENNGAEERRRMGSGGPHRLLLRLIRENYPSGYRVLCWNCNCGRAQNGGRCPHEDQIPKDVASPLQ